MIAKHLKKGSVIRMIAPSNYVGDRKEIYDSTKAWLETKGFVVEYSQYAFESEKYGVSAGTKEQRAQDFNDAFGDASVDAVWCMCGGNTAQEILPLIDFDKIQKNPKIFMGHSDIDVLHLAINEKTDLITFMAADPNQGCGKNFDYEYVRDAFMSRLVTKSKEVFPSLPRKTVRSGTATGKLKGCNVSSILKLAGTPYFPDFTDCILCLEGYRMDIPSSIARLSQLKNIGVFEKIKGILIGHMVTFDTYLKEEYNNDISFEEIVLDISKEYDFPILKIHEFGHDCNHAFLPIGPTVRIDADNKTVHILDDFLE